MRGTKTRILNKALGLFNQNGIERVGVREIARELKLSPGNLSYHFPSKEDLVSELFQNFEELVNTQITSQTFKEKIVNIPNFIERLELILKLQDCYKFLFVSFQSITEINLLRQRTIIIQEKRKQQLMADLRELQVYGYLSSTLNSHQIEQLADYILLKIRYRYLDAHLKHPTLSDKELTASTLKNIAEFLIWHAT